MVLGVAKVLLKRGCNLVKLLKPLKGVRLKGAYLQRKSDLA